MNLLTRELFAEVQHLQKSRRSLFMATVSADGIPEASYAPYLLVDGVFYILVSRLAKHASNLLSTQRCHVLFAEDEDKTSNLFARKRFSIQCESEDIARDTEVSETLLTQMREHHGPVVEMLRSLPDFHLIRLTPMSGTFVRGFGQAFSLDKLSLNAVLS